MAKWRAPFPGTNGAGMERGYSVTHSNTRPHCGGSRRLAALRWTFVDEKPLVDALRSDANAHRPTAAGTMSLVGGALAISIQPAVDPARRKVHPEKRARGWWRWSGGRHDE